MNLVARPDEDNDRELISFFAAELDNDAKLLTGRSVHQFAEELPDYARLIASEGTERVTENTLKHFRAVANIARDAGTASVNDSHFDYATTLERITQGFPLEALLRSPQIVTRVVWDWMIENPHFGAPRERIIRLCWPIWLDYMEQFARDAADTYVRVTRERARTHSRMRRSTMEYLMQGRFTQLEAERALDGLGFDSSRPYRLIVVRWWNTSEDRLIEIVDSARGLLESSLQEMLPVAPLTLASGHDIVLLAQWPVDKNEALKTRLEQILQRPEVRELEISGAISGDISDLAALHEFRTQVSHATAVTRSSRAIALAEDISLIDHAIAAVQDSFSRLCPVDLREFVNQNVRSAEIWHETLEMLAEEGLRVRDAAERLHVHPNTVYYRLNQMSALSGRDLNTVKGFLDVLITLRLRQQIEHADE